MATSVDALLDTAGRFQLLTAAEEIELGRQIREWLDWPDGEAEAPLPVRTAGKRALDRFLLANLRLAHFVAKRFHNRGVPTEDLMQAATEGLLGAIRRFKPALGFRFSSYGIWWAQQACQVLVAQQGGGIKLPTTVSEQLRKVSRTEERLQREQCATPTEAEVAAAAGMTVDQLRNLRYCARRTGTRSISAIGETALTETLPAPDNVAGCVEAQELNTILTAALEDSATPLTLQQRYIIRCRYLQQESISIPRLASRLNMNRMTVRRLEQRALAILRKQLGETMVAYLQG